MKQWQYLRLGSTVNSFAVYYEISAHKLNVMELRNPLDIKEMKNFYENVIGYVLSNQYYICTDYK